MIGVLFSCIFKRCVINIIIFLGIHWMSWEKFSMHKNYGRDEFQRHVCFQFGYIRETSMNILDITKFLSFLYFKAWYFSSRSYLTVNLGLNPSYIWRSILKARFKVRGGHVGVLLHVVLSLFLMNCGC